MQIDTHPPRHVGGGLLAFATLGLFLVWSNTFLAFEVLLVPRSGGAPMGWLDLVVARYVPVVLVCAPWCLCLHWRESIAVVRRFPIRLAACGFLAVAAYNGTLFYAMQQRVSGPVASLLTTLSPLYLVLLGVFVLGERVGWRQVAGLALGLCGVALVATAKEGGGAYARDVAILSLAPLSWSVYSLLTKSVAREVPPLLWTYLVLVVGGAPLFLLLPFHGGAAMMALDARGWGVLLFLSIVATVLGNAVWSWLLRHQPASTTGLTVFLNPPLTASSKRVLAWLFPAAFSFTILPREWLGGGLALAGVALAVLGGGSRRASQAPVAPPE